MTLQKHFALLVVMIIYGCSGDSEVSVHESQSKCPIELNSTASSYLEKAQIDPCSKTMQQTFKQGSEMVQKYSCALKNIIKVISKNKESIKTLAPDFPDFPTISETCLANLSNQDLDFKSITHKISGDKNKLKNIDNIDAVQKSLKDLQPTISALSFPSTIKGCSPEQIKSLNEIAKKTSEKIPSLFQNLKEATSGKDISDQSVMLDFVSNVLGDKNKCEKFKAGLDLLNQFNEATACAANSSFTAMTPPSTCPSSMFEFGLNNIGSLQTNMSAIDKLKKEIDSFNSSHIF